MATLKANGGLEVLRITYRAGHQDRVMSNGVVLRPRPGGGFRKRGKVKKGLTFGEVADTFRRAGCRVEHADLGVPLTMKPFPVKRMQYGAVNPGLLRAMAAQGVTKS